MSAGGYKEGCYAVARSIADAVTEHGMPHTFDLPTLHATFGGLAPPKAGRLLRGCLATIQDLIQSRHACIVGYRAQGALAAHVAVSPRRVCPRCHAPLRMCAEADPSCMHCDGCGWCGNPTRRTT